MAPAASHETVFATSFAKSRRNFLAILRTGHEDYIINAAVQQQGQARHEGARLPVLGCWWIEPDA